MIGYEISVLWGTGAREMSAEYLDLIAELQRYAGCYAGCWISLSNSILKHAKKGSLDKDTQQNCHFNVRSLFILFI